jgi:hypothetical protein
LIRSPSFSGVFSWPDYIRLDPRLLVDTDRDGKPDREQRRAFRGAQATVVEAAKTNLVGSTTMVWRWEDSTANGVADYNDYIATAEVLQCGAPRFEPSELGADPSCVNTCRNGACPGAWVGSDASKFRVAGALQIDEDSTESLPYELNGRKLLFDVALHSDFQPPELGGGTLTAAVCPQLLFNFRSSSAQYMGQYGAWQFGDGTCSPSTSGTSAPSCAAGVAPPLKQLPISMSAFGNASADSCGIDTRAAGTDVFTIGESSTCGPNTTMRHFELRVDQIDAAIGSSLETFGQVDFQQISAQLAEVKVYVFVGLAGDGKDFHCPAGVGAWLATSPTVGEPVQPGVAQVLEFSFMPDPRSRWRNVTGMTIGRWLQ